MRKIEMNAAKHDHTHGRDYGHDHPHHAAEGIGRLLGCKGTTEVIDCIDSPAVCLSWIR